MTHVYKFTKHGECMAEYDIWDDQITYYLKNCSDSDIHFVVLHVTIHEMCHWAIEDNTIVDTEHSFDWAEVINEAINYTIIDEYGLEVETDRPKDI